MIFFFNFFFLLYFIVSDSPWDLKNKVILHASYMLQTRIMELMVTPQLPTYKKKGSNENLTMWSRSLRHYPFIYIYIYSIYVYHSFLSLAQGLICLFYKITNQTYLPQSVTRDYKLFVQLTARQECNQIRQEPSK